MISDHKTQTTVYIYSDASFSKNFGIAVIGFAMFHTLDEHNTIHLKDIETTLCEIKETNNIRAEIRGALAALEACPMGKEVILYTDCQTIVDLPSRRKKLEQKNFISESKGRELANADLYKEFFALYDLKRPEIIWVKGHSSKRQTNIGKNFSHLDRLVRRKLRESTK